MFFPVASLRLMCRSSRNVSLISMIRESLSRTMIMSFEQLSIAESGTRCESVKTLAMPYVRISTWPEIKRMSR